MKQAKCLFPALGAAVIAAAIACAAPTRLTPAAQAKKQPPTEAKLAVKKNDLPAPVAKAVKENAPNAVIEKLTVEEQDGIKLYDIEFKDGRGEIEVAADGTVMDIATIIQAKDLPKPAAAAIQKTTDEAKARIKQLEKSEIRAELRKEGGRTRIVRLPAPKYVYEAELLKGEQAGEVTVAPDGGIVEALKWSEGQASQETAGKTAPGKQPLTPTKKP